MVDVLNDSTLNGNIP